MYSTARGNGYETHVNYQQMTLCGTDPPMVEYHNNEAFAGNFIPDYAGENWDPIPNGGVAGSLFVTGNSIWHDTISTWNPGSSPGDPAYCGAPTLCIPQWSNPGVGPHTLVEHVTRSFYVGSPNSRSGVRVQTDTFQMYTDSGWRTDIVTPNP